MRSRGRPGRRWTWRSPRTRRAKVELYAHVGGLRVAVYSDNTSTKAVTLIRAIAWGPDLSGTVGGAGGIGGLLSVRETSASTSSRKGLTMLLGHDAKGDVTSVWSSDGAYLGGYVTQAFGQVAIHSGSATYLSENQWRLASKPLEWLTGYSHWGRRWYSPFLGRWVSRDPIGENGGVNLYGSCGNDMVSGLDPWGEKDYYVYIWEWKGLGFMMEGDRVGHVMIVDAVSMKSIWSPFPHGPQEEPNKCGPNTQLTFDETLAEEGGPPTKIFRIHIPPKKDAEFESKIAEQVKRPFWNWWPTDEKQTNCAYGASIALNSVGLKVDSDELPGELGDDLDKLAALGKFPLNKGDSVSHEFHLVKTKGGKFILRSDRLEDAFFEVKRTVESEIEKNNNVTKALSDRGLEASAGK